MMPEARVWTREEMMKRVALFKDQSGSKEGLPESHLPQCEKELINIIGFRPPQDGSMESPVGANSSKRAAIDIYEGFNMGFVKCKPGKGPLMHNHDTNETFMPITGTWRCEWNEGDDHDFVDVGPLDVVSFPPTAIRRFMNVTEGDDNLEHVLLVVIGGDAPSGEFSDAAWQRIREFEAENPSG